MTKEKVILAYSGGLDTSVIVKWLQNKNYDVICYVANVGQNEDFEKIKEKALKTGASKVYIEDLREEFVTDYIYPALRGNAIYEGRYLLGTALARPLISKKHIEIAHKEGAKYVSHGATGKGNDQVRFEFTYYNYAEKYNIPVKASKAKSYSEDENLMHISHEAGILEDPDMTPGEEIFSMTTSPKNAPDVESCIEI